jgi:hypothetical protein
VTRRNGVTDLKRQDDHHEPADAPDQRGDPAPDQVTPHAFSACRAM